MGEQTQNYTGDDDDVILNVGMYRLNHSDVRDRDANNPMSLN